MSIFNLFREKPPTEARPELEPETPILSEGHHQAIFEGVMMHCNGCKALVESELRESDGIIYLNADIRSQSVTVTFDPNRVDVDTLQTAIQQAGYKPKSQRLIT